MQVLCNQKILNKSVYLSKKKNRKAFCHYIVTDKEVRILSYC